MLRFVDDAMPGITRKRRGRYWMYFGPDGERITDRDEIDRLNAIGLPPAYERAWLCPHPNGHIQATGYDAKGRKQYRYHLDFRARQEAAKYEGCAKFGRALPKLRKRVEEDLARRTVTQEAVAAAVVRLLDQEYLRVGNEAYARDNKSFGATTLRSRHAKILGRSVKMRFKGKHGIERELTITDRNLIRIVRRCEDLPGQNLFQYVDDEGNPQPITSEDVNEYIRDAMGEEFTAKHFRTWGASVIAFEAICKAGEEGISLKQLLEPVAEALGNTPAISRKSYVHPALIEAVKANPRNPAGDSPCPRATRYLSSVERGLIQFLERSAGTRRRAKGAA
jgi:DNA topoisomerase I